MIKRNLHNLRLFALSELILLFIDLIRYRLSSNYSSNLLKRKYQYDLAYQKGYLFGKDRDKLVVKNSDERFYLRRNSSDWEVFNQIFLEEEYKYLTNINENEVDVIVDLGSNIGLTVLYLNSFYNRAKFYCVEPFYDNWELLKENCEPLVHSKSVFYNRAAWSDNSELFINKNFRDGLEWSINVSPNSDNSIAKIKGISIPQITEENKIDKIDILKIDIEGAERDLLQKPEFLLITQNIAIEVHEEFVKKEEVKNLLLSYGFQLYDNGETIFGRKE